MRQDKPIEVSSDYGADWMTFKFYLSSDDVFEYCFDGEIWEDTKGITVNEKEEKVYIELKNLSPNTEYEIHIRIKENDRYLVSKVAVERRKTSKYEQSIPNVSYEQMGKTFTIIGGSEAMEYTFDGHSVVTGNEIYGSETTHTYDKIGLKKICVRYKETDTSRCSEKQEIYVYSNNYDGGKGTEEAPFLIANYEQ